MACKNDDCGCKSAKQIINKKLDEILNEHDMPPVGVVPALRIPLLFKKLPNFYSLPNLATPSSAAMDIYAAENATVRYGEISKIATGIAIQMPPGFGMYILSRSGMSSKGIIVANAPGLIDADYRAEIFILLAGINKNSPEFTISRGDRIAQIQLMPIIQIDFIETENLDESSRLGGFGSSGK